jgi:hypothetical protein
MSGSLELHPMKVREVAGKRRRPVSYWCDVFSPAPSSFQSVCLCCQRRRGARGGFGAFGCGKTDYEQIVGKLHFEIDPKLPGNAVIADVGLAPVNAAGKVGFSSGLRILKPKDEARSNGAAWVEIPNRGGKATASDWVVKHGFTVLNVGWEFDLPADKLRIEVPSARNPDGSAIRGVVSATFTPDKEEDEQLLTDLTDYPPVDLNGPDSRLIVRNRWLIRVASRCHASPGV